RSPNCGGRFNGTLRMSSVLQTPSRLGCPHDVTGGSQSGSDTAAAVISAGTALIAEGSPVAPERCPAAGMAASTETAAATAAANRGRSLSVPAMVALLTRDAVEHR